MNPNPVRRRTMGTDSVAPERPLYRFLADIPDTATRPRDIAALARLLELAYLGLEADREIGGELVGDHELIAYLASTLQCVTSTAADLAEGKAVA
jgi:hypothetical protein